MFVAVGDGEAKPVGISIQCNNFAGCKADVEDSELQGTTAQEMGGGGGSGRGQGGLGAVWEYQQHGHIACRAGHRTFRKCQEIGAASALSTLTVPVVSFARPHRLGSSHTHTHT
jgi:hypothetical protein